jgi:hypothetical protein
MALKLGILVHHHVPNLYTRGGNCIKHCDRIMPLFQLRIYVKVCVPPQIFSKCIDINIMALKLCILVHHHVPNLYTRGGNCIKHCDRIIHYYPETSASGKSGSADTPDGTNRSEWFTDGSARIAGSSDGSTESTRCPVWSDGRNGSGRSREAKQSAEDFQYKGNRLLLVIVSLVFIFFGSC